MGETTEELEMGNTRRIDPQKKELKLTKEVPDSVHTSELTRLAAPEQIRAEIPSKFAPASQKKAESGSSSSQMSSCDLEDNDSSSNSDKQSEASIHSSDYE